jgi:transcriptional regulator with XRE-family HTH domain
MAQLAEIGEVKTRAEALNLSLKRIARRSAVDPSTLYRAAGGKGGNTGSTLRKICEELEAEEIRVARHLASLPHVKTALAEEDAA